MPLHDVESLILETASAAESLPALGPVAVQNRTHVLSNTGAVNAVWSCTSGFVENGVNVATITVPPGTQKIVQAIPVLGRWRVAPIDAATPVQAGTVVTNGSGVGVWTFPTPFTAAPVVTAALGPTNDNALVEAKLTAITTTQATVHVRRAPAVTILGISVITFPVNASGVTVQLHAKAVG